MDTAIPTASVPDAPRRQASRRSARSAQQIDQGHGTELVSMTGLALKKARHILLLKADPKKSTYARILSTQASIIGIVINAQIRVEENRLREGRPDALTGLLKLIKAQDAARHRTLGADAEPTVIEAFAELPHEG